MPTRAFPERLHIRDADKKIHPCFYAHVLRNLQVLLKRIEAGNFDEPSPGGGSSGGGVQSRTSSPGTPVPSGMNVNGPPLPPAAAHSVGPPGSSPGLGPQWDAASAGSLGGMPRRGGGGMSLGVGGLSRVLADERGMGHGGPAQGHLLVGASSSGAGGPQQPQQQGSSNKRPRIPSGNGSGGGAPGAGMGNGQAVGNGGGGGAGGAGRSTPPHAMDDAPPSIPMLGAAVSQLIVTPPGGAAGGGDGQRGGGFGFNSQLAGFPEGGTAPGGPGSVSGAPPSAGPRLALERSLPTGVTDPTEVIIPVMCARVCGNSVVCSASYI